MGKKKELTWFKVHGDIFAIIEDMGDEAIGKAFHDAVRFFYVFQDKKTVREPRLEDNDIEGRMLFRVLRNYILDTVTHYNETVKNRSEGAKKRREKELREQIAKEREQEQDEMRREAERKPTR